MRRFLLLFSTMLLFSASLWSQTSLAGKITDEESGEPILFGSVALYKNDVLITGTETDFDGNYNFSNIDPGTYSVEASYVGYQTQRITGVKVLAGKANKADIQLNSGGGVVLDLGVEVKAFANPLIEQDNTTSGQTLTSDQIQKLPFRSINAIAATAAGASSSDEGEAINLRGSRSNATDYYVDGIRVRGSLIPESEIEQLQVITGGVGAQYGDVTGGVISITTKGPANRFSGTVDLETSQFTDAYDQSILGLALSGPILKNDKGISILGYRFSGRYTYRGDDDPPGPNVFRVNDAKLAELEANPLLETTINNSTNTFAAAEFLTNEDVLALDAKPVEQSNRLDVTARLDARLSDAIDISFTGSYRDSENRFTPGGWRLLNSHNNPIAFGENLRGIFRFRHRLGGGVLTDAQKSKKSALIQNASYSLQFAYERGKSNSHDIRHDQNYFNYGYIGKFDIEWAPTFRQVFDPTTLQPYLLHIDNFQVLRSYTPGSANPVLANYNNLIMSELGIVSGEGVNSAVPELINLDAGLNFGQIVTRENFIARNGSLAQFGGVWNFHNNVGQVYNDVDDILNETYTLNASASFDLVPGGSDKGRHNIQLGFIYEQRVNRRYRVFPFGLWGVARRLANAHIDGVNFQFDDNNILMADTIGFVDLEGFPQTALLGLRFAENEDNLFFQKVRQLTGQSLGEFVNVDGIDPQNLTLDLFSARELNDNNVLSYFGYDYLGNQFDGTFEDFFTTTAIDPVTGTEIRTFPVAPNRPIYSAAYIQDKFTFKDIIFRLGVRVDRYDANTKVLKDLFSLYEVIGAGEYHSRFGGTQPGNIANDYKVYLDDSGNNVALYRNGEEWFSGNGTPINNFAQEFRGVLNPRYASDAAEADVNFIKKREFDPNVSFEDYEVQVNVMPRLAFSFPISSEANFFAHYDILVQRPPSNTLATPLSYFYFLEVGSGLRNNPALRPERTIDYEVGFKQKVSNTSAITLSAYYKELRDMIQERVLFPVPEIGSYSTFDNIDFGTVKGFSFAYDLRRTGNFSLQANYTMQFADGTGSSASSQRGLNNNGNIRTLSPLSYDERHRLNATMDFRFASGRFYNGPELFGKNILENAGINLQLVAVSGRPYTQTLTPTEFGGQIIAGAINGARKPWNYTLNLRVDKSFNIGKKVTANVFVRISNLLDRRNVVNVYSASGSPTDSGFLLSQDGENQLANIGNVREEFFLASYQWALLNPNNFTLPRRIYVGANFGF